MARTVLLIAFLILARLLPFAQATSLEVDCQTPGLLAAYISPEDIPTLRNLKVTGIINETDLKTIGNLVKNYSLQGRLDLEDVAITEDRLSYQMFGVTGCSLQYFSIPKSIERDKLEKCILWVTLDTLVIGGTQAYDVNSQCNLYSNDFRDFRVKCIMIREGTTKCSFMAAVNLQGNDPNYSVTEIIMPQSMEEILSICHFRSLSKMNIPNNIKTLGSLSGCKLYVNSDTLFVPLSVTFFDDYWANPDGYYGCNGNDGDIHPGRIKYVYLPEGLEQLETNCGLHYQNARVIIHMRSKTPPQSASGYGPPAIGDNCTIYVPEGCKATYPTYWKNVIEEVYAKTIEINLPEFIHKGDSLLATANILPENTTFKDIYWSSDNTSLLSISNNDMLHALECGSVLVSAKTADRYCTATKEVQIYEHTTGIELNQQELTINIGELGYLVANTLPLGLSDNQVRWSSSNELIATVDEKGVIKAIKQGECLIFAESIDGGFVAQCVVKVKQPVVGVVMEKHSITLNVGQSEMLYATASPVNADNKKLIWSSTDAEIAEVDADGNVIAKKRGVAFIKATSEDNPLAVDSCRVTVNQPVTGVTLNHKTCELHQIGEILQLVATVLPEDASNKEVRWASSNEQVCIVSNGTVVAVGYGISVILVTTVDGSFMATCTVTVVEGADLPGDVNLDGEVNIADLNAIIDIILGGNVDDQTRERADVNGDGEVNIADINGVIDAILGH